MMARPWEAGSLRTLRAATVLSYLYQAAGGDTTNLSALITRIRGAFGWQTARALFHPPPHTHTHTHHTPYTITLRACVSYCTCQSVWGLLVWDDRPPTPPRGKKSLRVLPHNNLLVVTWISPQDLTGNRKPGTGNFSPHFFFSLPNHHRSLQVSPRREVCAETEKSD